MVCGLCVTFMSCDNHDCEVIPESQIELEKISNDNSLSDNSKSMIYGSIAIGVYSINFWDLNQNVYNITQEKL